MVKGAYSVEHFVSTFNKKKNKQHGNRQTSTKYSLNY